MDQPKHLDVPPLPDGIADWRAIASPLWARRRLVAGVAVGTVGLTLAISLVIPKTFTAEATLLPQQPHNTTEMLSAGIGSQLGVAAGLLGMGSENSEAETLGLILNSRSIVQRVIDQCHLEREFKWRYREELVLKVRSLTHVTGPTLRSKLITVRVDAPRAQLASDMANAYISQLGEIRDAMSVEGAGKNRRFIAKQLDKTRQELAEAESKLSEFQAKHRIASLPDTVTEAIRAVSQLEIQRTQASVTQSAAEETYGTLKEKVNALQADPDQLISLDLQRKKTAAEQAAIGKAQQRFLEKLTSLPPKGMELARLQRNVQVENAIYLALRQQYETALLNEGHESDTFVVLDAATPPPKSSRPRLLVNLLSALLGGLMLGGLVAFFSRNGVTRPRDIQ